jgi:hypothetical protein
MSEVLHRHRLEGLEPDNLLAFLALLGLLRSLETARPAWRPRAAWDLDRGPLRPILLLAEPHAQRDITEAAVEGAGRLAELYDFSAEKSDDPAQKDLNYTDACARGLLSEAAAEENRERADLWAALMCDAAAREGRIEATPLCLLFGQGHQHFLERLATVPRTEAPPPRGRGSNRVSLTASETIEEALFVPWLRQDPTPGFRWDPEEDVRYALRAGDPSAEKSTTQHGANRLAALGLPILTAAPVQRGNRVRLQVLGGSVARDFTFAWPIWREPASLAAIRAMLSHPDLTGDPATAQTKLAHLGVEQVRRARRIGVGRFMNFTRAEVIG